MRLWSLHPKYLDARGLVALWREALLAQSVLRGRTLGYVHHPQLLRFRERPSPVGAISAYLREIHAESLSRGYDFAMRKIGRGASGDSICVTRGQVEFEWEHLLGKLVIRDPEWRCRLESVKRPRPHPLFRVVAGGVEAWERGVDPPSR